MRQVKDSPEPAYLRALAAIRERIKDGTYQDRMPSQKALADELGVAQSTVAHAIGILKEDGIVETSRNGGTFVSSRAHGQERMNT